MKKKLLLTLLASACAVACALGVAACDMGGGGGGGDGHHYASGWTSSPTQHWHKCTDEDCEEKKDLAEHSDANNDGTCDVCKNLIPSVGLEFGTYSDVYDPDNLGVVAITGLGTCTDTDIVLPSANEEGKPVLAIELAAFQESDITSVVIPDSIVVVGGGSFAGCQSLNRVTIMGNNLKRIGDSAFISCPNLKNIAIPEGVTHIGAYAFMEAALESLSVPSSLTSVGDNAFSYFVNKGTYNEYENGYYVGNAQNPYVVLVETITSPQGTFTVHENTKIIHDHAFSGSSKLELVIMSANVVFIGDRAFASCPLACIQFGGTLAQWEAIEKGNFRAGQGGDMVVTCTDDVKGYPMV